MSSERDRTFSVIGAGRLATALAVALEERGWRAHLVASRTEDSARRLANRLDAAHAEPLEEIRDVPGSVVFISVSDDALERVASFLALTDTDWVERDVLHTSGTWPSDVLEPLRRAGARTASFHPVQTFTQTVDARSAGELFAGIPIAVEGGDEAVKTAFETAERLGAAPFRLPPGSKTLFHAAAVMGSNYLATLMSLAGELADAAVESTSGAPGGARASADPAPEGQPGEVPAARRYFDALARKAITNVMEMGPDQALTGPIARGDLRVLERHLEELGRRAPGFVPAYATLATETIRLAASAGSISHESAETMLDTIARALDAWTASHGT